MIQLIKWEIRTWSKNKLFYVFVVMLIISIAIDFGTPEMIDKPDRNNPVIGHWENRNIDDVMTYYLGHLVFEYNSNGFSRHGNGIHSKIELQQSSLKEVDNVFYQITGKSLGEIKIPEYFREDENALDIYYNVLEMNDIDIIVDTEHFFELMDQIDLIIGGSSTYNHENQENIMTYGDYDEEIKEYNGIVYEDKISNAYARLFCDYAVIELSLLPIFLAVSRCLRDQRGNLKEIICTKRCSSSSIIISRYVTIVGLIMLCVLTISVPYQLWCMYYGQMLDVEVDVLAFGKNVLIWVLPSVMVVTSFGFVVTEMTDSIVAIFLQMIWWFIDVELGTENLIGRFALHIAPRFNKLGGRDIFDSQIIEFVENRVFYIFLSFLFLGGTVIVYELKRRGGPYRREKIF